MENAKWPIVDRLVGVVLLGGLLAVMLVLAGCAGTLRVNGADVIGVDVRRSSISELSSSSSPLSLQSVPTVSASRMDN